MAEEYRTRELTLPLGTASVVGVADLDLNDVELLERYPRVAEMLACWELAEAQ